MGSERVVAPSGVCRTRSATMGKPRRKIRWMTAISSVRGTAACWDSVCIGASPSAASRSSTKVTLIIRYT